MLTSSYIVGKFKLLGSTNMTLDSLKNMSKDMLGLASGALKHANWHANYYSTDNEYWNELSVLQAAHACEIFIKARIAEEHPLLIFERLPKIIETDTVPYLQRVIESGRTYQYSDLPDRLFAITGVKIPNLEKYKEFGNTRNSVQHCLNPPGKHMADEAISYIYEVIDPFINECWGLYAIDHNEDHEPYQYLVEGLIRRGVRFLVSPECASNFSDLDFEWPKDDVKYKGDMTRRFEDGE